MDADRKPRHCQPDFELVREDVNDNSWEPTGVSFRATKQATGQRNLVFKATEGRLWPQYHPRYAEGERGLASDANCVPGRRWFAAVQPLGRNRGDYPPTEPRDFEWFRLRIPNAERSDG
jgi:hypothetical protein